MNLILHQRYPYPYPQGLSEAEQAEISERARDPEAILVLHDVVHFEWLHTVTVEIATISAMCRAADLTGWDRYERDRYILEAPTSEPDGYDHPAIVARNWCYCGFILKER